MRSGVFKRVILKLSGEALAGEQGYGVNFLRVKCICLYIKECVDFGVQIGVVVGGGNFWRGRESSNINSCVADQMGMMATVMNALYLRDVFQQMGVPCRLMATVPISGVAGGYDYKEADLSLNRGAVLIFGGGTGNTHFSTDSAASLRTAELGADVLLKATTVAGVYDSDPRKNKNAVLYSSLSYDEVLKKGLRFMDSTAVAMCKDNNIKVLVFNVSDPLNIKKAIFGERLGTFVGCDDG